MKILVEFPTTDGKFLDPAGYSITPADIYSSPLRSRVISAKFLKLLYRIISLMNFTLSKVDIAVGIYVKLAFQSRDFRGIA